MIIIDNSYFQGELYLPDLEYRISDDVAAALQIVGENNLGWFADKYEYEYLVKLLGKSFADAFIKGLKDDPADKKWSDLKDHLIIDTGENRYSPIANYIYYWVMRSGKTKTAVTGEKVGKSSYTSTAYIGDKVVKAWNDMADMSVGFLVWLKKNNKPYEEYQTGNPDWRDILSKINTIGL
ncbi:MAG: hypothetical protein FWF54_03610 [Candidatus Azobacteroides sp.]|nr:hypothetical protein [Candidatus Azobacteroides sp.]